MGFTDCMARSCFLVFRLALARMAALDFNCGLARNGVLGFIKVLARMIFNGFQSSDGLHLSLGFQRICGSQ